MSTNDNLKLKVANFGPIARAEIDLRPLTVFVGPSNTGKSYLATLIYALHRFFSGNASYRSFTRPIYRRTRRTPFSRHDWERLVGLDISEEESEALFNWLREILPQLEKARFRAIVPDDFSVWIRSLLQNMRFEGVLDDEIVRCFGIGSTEKLIRHRNRNGAEVAVSRRTSGDPIKFGFTLKGGQFIPSISIPQTATFHIEARSGTTDWIRRLEDVDEVRGDERYEHANLARGLIGDLSDDIGSKFVSPLTRIAHYLPADRTGVMHAHRVIVGSLISRAPLAGLGREEPLPVLSGVLADFLMQLVMLDNSPRRPRSSGERLSERLERDMLQGRIINESSDVGYPVFSYRPEGWEDEDIPLMRSSSMVSELAPVVLYLRHVVRPGDVLVIEEPESHLHPTMQVEFVRQLAGLVRSGVRVMLTTHSEWVLDELANLVRLSELPKSRRKQFAGADSALEPEELGMWLFEPKKRPRGTVVKEIPLDPAIGNFRSGYDEVATDTYNRWAKISNLIEENGSP